MTNLVTIALAAMLAPANAAPAGGAAVAVATASARPASTADVARATAGRRLARGTHPARRASRRRGRKADPVSAANRAAARVPTLQGYLNAVQVYPYSEGALYRLYTAPGRVSDIALQPGETLVSVAAGDTSRWVIGDTTSGSGASRRSHILVKPSADGLATNLVVTTDRRVYQLELESHARPAMAAMSWTYAEDVLLALRREPAAVEPRYDGEGPRLDRLSFGYTISGDKPRWRPLRAFDDGRHVYVEFPESIGSAEAPPLFVTGAAGKAELVNYRMSGHFYVVDRLFESAELRLGERRQQIVRIRRQERGR